MLRRDSSTARPPRAALDAAFDRTVREAIGPMCLTLAVLYVIFTLAHHVFLPRHAALVMVPLTAAGLVAVLALRAYAPRVPAGRAHALAFVIGLVALSNSLTLMAVTGEPKQTTNIILLVVAAGYLLLSTRWTVAYLAVAAAGWSAIAWASPSSPDWKHFTFAFISGLALAWLVHQLRARSAARLEAQNHALREAALAAERSETRLRTVIEAAPLVLAAIDAEGRITFCQGRWLARLDVEPEALVNRSVFEVAAHRPELLEDVRRALAGESRVTHLSHDGWALEARWTPSPAGGAVVVAFDVSDRVRAKATTAELERMRELDAMKVQFMNHAAHELSTPLTPLRLQVALLRTSRDEASRRKGLDLLERNILRLQRLVQDLLDSSRLQAHRLNVQHEPLDLAGVAAEAVEAFAPAARAQGVHLELEAPAPLPVEGDAARLHQVLTNLLSNALKFTPAGGRVNVRARVVDGEARVGVRDSGVGMAREDAARLFQPFTQLADGAAKGGTGLGLHISKGLVELHGGRIWCESEGAGRGATFAFSLPLAAAATGQASPSGTPAGSPPSRA